MNAETFDYLDSINVAAEDMSALIRSLIRIGSTNEEAYHNMSSGYIAAIGVEADVICRCVQELRA